MNEDSSVSPLKPSEAMFPAASPAARQRGYRRGRVLRPKPRNEETVSDVVNVADLLKLPQADLKSLAAKTGAAENNDGKEDLIRQVLCAHAEKQGMKFQEGVLEISRGGYGFLRSPQGNYQPRIEDTYITSALMERFGLRPGDQVSGMARPPRPRERYHTLAHVDLIWNEAPDQLRQRAVFEDLTALHPQKRLVLETEGGSVSMRVLDLLAPLGRGQRCLLVAPPRAGKTVMLQQIAESVAKNDPDVDVLVLLLDERPEEVHAMRRVVKGEVISSTFDESVERHVRIAELIIEKAHRLVENGRHVLLLLDSLTRMARAYNALSPSRGKVMSGGMESGALVKPRKFFSSARNVENGGSLTIVGTVLVETGGKMDDLIFEEFKGTGNMEVYLSRDLQERRIFPAIHIEKSGTRREDMLYHPDEYLRIRALRRQLTEYPPLEAMEKLIEQLQATRSNAELLMRLKLE